MLDIVMPGMDGFAVCAAIRQSPAGEHTPIVMMTGLDDSDSINRAFEAGATTFITKPLNLVILTHRLRYILRTQADRGRAARQPGAAWPGPSGWPGSVTGSGIWRRACSNAPRVWPK